MLLVLDEINQPTNCADLSVKSLTTNVLIVDTGMQRHVQEKGAVVLSVASKGFFKPVKYKYQTAKTAKIAATHSGRSRNRPSLRCMFACSYPNIRATPAL